ncbi:hypothetical protein Ciccas_010557 [Cichlidogyrus casuarinus]|uniref:Uncharacterized protein n=1 Tax=Cichlidogyrus casuarinus TaxID=1844966 RepID=A0ABD2PTS6_9PLAT
MQVVNGFACRKTENEKRKAVLWSSIEKAAKLNETMLCKSAKQTVRVALRSSVNSAPVTKATEELSLSGSFNWLNKYGLGSGPMTVQPSASTDQAVKASTSTISK